MADVEAFTLKKLFAETYPDINAEIVVNECFGLLPTRDVHTHLSG
jgi:hypothetical protein